MDLNCPEARRRASNSGKALLSGMLSPSAHPVSPRFVPASAAPLSPPARRPSAAHGSGLSSAELSTLRRIGLVSKHKKASATTAAARSASARKASSPRGIAPSPAPHTAVSPSALDSPGAAASSTTFSMSAQRRVSDAPRLHITPLRQSSRAAARGEHAQIFLAETADASTLEELNTAVEKVAREVLQQAVERRGGAAVVESAVSVELFLSSDGVPEAVLPPDAPSRGSAGNGGEVADEEGGFGVRDEAAGGGGKGSEKVGVSTDTTGLGHDGGGQRMEHARGLGVMLKRQSSRWSLNAGEGGEGVSGISKMVAAALLTSGSSVRGMDGSSSGSGGGAGRRGRAGDASMEGAPEGADVDGAAGSAGPREIGFCYWDAARVAADAELAAGLLHDDHHGRLRPWLVVAQPFVVRPEGGNNQLATAGVLVACWRNSELNMPAGGGGGAGAMSEESVAAARSVGGRAAAAVAACVPIAAAVLGELAALAAPVLRRAEMHDDALRLGAQNEAILDLIAAVTAKESVMPVDTLTQMIVDAAYKVAPSARITLFMVDVANKELWCRLSKDKVVIRAPLGVGLAGNCAADGRVLRITDAYRDDRFDRTTDQQTGFRTKSVMCLPVQNGHGECLAVLQCINSFAGRFSNGDEQRLRRLLPAMLRAVQRIASETMLDNANDSKVKSMLVQMFAYTSPKYRKAPRRRSKRRVSMLWNSMRAATTGMKGLLAMGTFSDGGAGAGAPVHAWHDWTYDSLAPALAEEDLVIDALGMVKHFDLIAHFGLPALKLHNYFTMIGNNYAPNPYHNFRHALGAMHVVFMMLTCKRSPSSSASGGDDGAKEAKEAPGTVLVPADPQSTIADDLTTLDILAALVGALVHDVDHSGKNNGFEVGAATALAIQYNDKSVLENHHAATAFRILGDPECDFTLVLDPAVRKEYRKLVIKGVLGTDMAEHKGHIQAAEHHAREDPINPEDADHRAFLVSFMLHLGDLSNPVSASFDSARRWADLVCAEFTETVEAEKQADLPVSAFMDGLDNILAKAVLQQGFYTFVARPLWASAAKLYPQLQTCVDNLDSNSRQWKALEVEEKAKAEAAKEKSLPVL